MKRWNVQSGWMVNMKGQERLLDRCMEWSSLLKVSELLVIG